MDKTEFEKMLERKAAEEQAAKILEEVQETPEVIIEEPAAEDTELESLQKALEAAVLERDGLMDQLLRARADFDNYKKRNFRDMEQLRATASINLVRALLPVLDNMERALAHAAEENPLTEGILMVRKQLLEVLGAEGLTAIEAKGAEFDPNYHEALAMTPADCSPGTVMEEYERGYLLRDVLLRPAKVIVSCELEDSVSDEGEADSDDTINETVFSETEEDEK